MNTNRLIVIGTNISAFFLGAFIMYSFQRTSLSDKERIDDNIYDNKVSCNMEDRSKGNAAISANENISVPDIVVPAVETRYSGSTLYVSSHSRPSYPAVNVKFTIDNQFNNYWVIYQWLNLMRDQNEGTYGIVNARNLADNPELLRDYATIFTLYGTDEFNNNVIRWDFHSAFPTKLGGIEWNEQNQEGTEIQCSFEFVFSKITSELV